MVGNYLQQDKIMSMVYVAAPFFNEQEIENLNRLQEFLFKEFPDIDFFFPREHKISDGESLPNEEWAKQVYELDTEALRKSESVIALYDGHYSDTGCAWEIGYACALNKPITLLIVDCNKDQSIMPINCANFVFDFEEFINPEKLYVSDPLTKINQK